MSRLFLVGHTGSLNRGCEAIVRSTVQLFNGVGIYDIHTVTDRLIDDKKLKLDRVCALHQTQNRSRYSPRKITAKILRKKIGYYMPDEKLRQWSILKELNKDDIVLMIGGDTYCYGRPVGHYAAHKMAKKRGAKTILWACSLEENLIDAEMLKDLNAYDLICPREKITYQTLINKGIAKEKLMIVSDPAFNMDMKHIEYPQILDENKTVGINISPIVMRNETAKKAVRELIEYIIDNTELNILFIPHVYSDNGIDLDVLNTLYDEYKASGKVGIVNSSLSCLELKYIISKCRMFIGARTHSTIAAYSNCIPTLVIGYSVKSRGIAEDLFNTYEKHVVMYDNLPDRELIDNFIYMSENESELSKCLKEVMPSYKEKTLKAVEIIKALGNFKKEKKLFYDFSNCSGCTACVKACPKKCITLKGNEEGFLYPQINYSECINCGICESVCHYKNSPDTKKCDIVYAAFNNDEEIRVNSSSGGVFYELAKWIVKKDGIVFGASYDKDFNVVHCGIEKEEDIRMLMGSKYVQSDIGDTYKRVQDELNADRYVLFTGTPCQVNGLLAYLGKDYENLLTMDFICHGVPSPKVWRKYLDEKINEFGSNIKAVSFRDKKFGWKNFSMKIEFENGKAYISKVTEDKFLRHFLTDISLRNSCYNCNAKGINRAADITVADFWGIVKINPNMNDDKGVSIIMIRGEKAKGVFLEISDCFTVIESDIDTVLKYNPSVTRSVSKNPLRRAFFKCFDKFGFGAAYEKCCGQGILAKVRRKLTGICR